MRSLKWSQLIQEVKMIIRMNYILIMTTLYLYFNESIEAFFFFNSEILAKYCTMIIDTDLK